MPPKRVNKHRRRVSRKGGFMSNVQISVPPVEESMYYRDHMRHAAEDEADSWCYTNKISDKQKVMLGEWFESMKGLVPDTTTIVSPKKNNPHEYGA